MKNLHAKLVYLHPGKAIEILNERELVLPLQLVL